MLSWMAKRDAYANTADFLREEFGGSPNIEDVITALDARIKALEGFQDLERRLQRSNAAHQRSKLREAVPIWFTEIHANPASAYQKFAERIVQSGDVIITFNYDDSLERELKRAGKWDVSQGYGFQIGTLIQPSPVLVLKLHGSMNWLVSIFGGITSGAFAASDNSSLGQCPCIATDYLKYLGYPDMPGNFPGGGGFPSLILPGRTKEFYYETSFGPEHEEFFSSLWKQASAALQRASRVVLCGYSLLPVDDRACDLLLNATNRGSSIVVVSGGDGQRITNTFRDAGFQNVECYSSGYFEAWVESTTSRVASA